MNKSLFSLLNNFFVSNSCSSLFLMLLDVFAEVIYLMTFCTIVSMFTVEEQLQLGHVGSAEGSEGEEWNLAAVLQMSCSLLREDQSEARVVSFFLSHILH